MTAEPQPVPDAVLTAALGGYYGHPTAITAADPDVIDGLTAGLAAGLAEARKDERATVAEGLSKAAAGYRRSAKRGGVLKYEMERRATILEFHAERITRGTS